MDKPIDKARAFAFAETGIQKPATIESFSELSADEKKRVNDSMAFYIVENPSQFGEKQLEVSRAIVNRPTFGRDLDPIETITFAEAFGEQVQKTVEKTSDVAGKAVVGGISGLLGGNLFTIGAIAIAGFVAFKLVTKK